MNIMKLLSNKMVILIIILLLVGVVFVTAYDSNDLSPGEITDVFTLSLIHISEPTRPY